VPAQPRRWVAWVPVLGLVVQLMRMQQALWRPAHHRGGVDPRERAQLLVAALVTAGTLVGVILAMIVLELMDGRG
jgi:hypothetical protein